MPMVTPIARDSAGDHILLIEDDFFIADMYKRQLELSGFVVDLAYDAEEGWTKLEQGDYKLLLLDIMLPKGNGLDIMRRVRADHRLKNLPIVIVSNFGSNDLESEAFRLGAIKYITKADVTPAELAQIIKEQPWQGAHAKAK
jgi:DNA-binding response OmpR family regulator